ncbi:SpoIIE family protein phosphatase [Streptomyces eurocidicus]|uniref:PAS domain S-box-containing protein n=2 Tax=Streptomyces eurocidicus TaxID=66423 RepID=A0A7W8BCR6_STREU|nr:SpoIIE family protein phosphatase [Streptomyces eurocidicus]MBB5120997.1 PAS domain S-box-containing protein [Streptomyces eurocidicus]MBF6055722.1 SpoIIE family protein phosphatase [Streptomyces eurocidicus]
MDAYADTPSRPAAVPVAAVDAAGAVTLWSPAARQWLGWSPDEIVGRPAAGLLAAPLPGPARTALLRHQEWSGIVRARHRGGDTVRIPVRACPCRSGPDTVLWLLLAPSPDGRDPRAEPADPLREWAYTQSPIAASVYDHENRLAGANDEMVRISGRPEREILGLRLAEIHPGPPFEEFGRMMDEVLRTGEPVRTDAYFRAPGESRERAWASFFTPLKDAAGTVRGVSLAALDRTEQYWARERLALVNDAGARIGTTLDVTRTAEELTEVTTGGFADFAAVDLLESVAPGDEPRRDGDPGAATLRRSAARRASGAPVTGAAGPGTAHTYPPHSPPARALASGLPCLRHTDDPALRAWLTGTPAFPDDVLARGVWSVLAVPLSARGTVLGVVTFLLHRGPDAVGAFDPAESADAGFDADDVLLAEEVAARAGTCLDNARRYALEREVALTLQRNLLPSRLPEQGAVEVTSRYLPAGSQAGIGGDWFDVIPLSGARVALVVGDVVGHGLQASAVMGRLRAALRTLADLDLPPDELLTHLDDLVIQLAQDQAVEAAGPGAHAVRETGATCLYVVYDPVSRRCVMARAGHPAPLLVTPDGTARYLDIPSGPPLGLGGLPFESAELELPEGSLLALYTDGLVEGRDHDIGAGLETLRGTLSGPAGPLETTCDAVLAALLPDRAERPADDIALLLARTRSLGPAHVRSWELPSDRASVADARKRASEQLAAWGLEELSFTTELVVSELVTNAVRYGYAPIRLRLIRDAAALICEVSDASSTSPRMRRARVFDEGGRGLLLVAQLTERWGTRFTADGKTIWAEQVLPAAPEPMG